MNGKQLYIQNTKIMKFTIFVKCENTMTGKFQSMSKYKNHKIHYFCLKDQHDLEKTVVAKYKNREYYFFCLL